MENKKKKIVVKKSAATKKSVKRSVDKVKRAAKAKNKPAPKQELRIVGLDFLRPPAGAHKPKKLLGRGPSSGHGKTSTRGSKGQTSRAGRDFYLGFEGGQTPLIRRIPKRGFTSRSTRVFQIVNLVDLSRVKETTITPVELAAVNLIKDKDKPVKILGTGQVDRALAVSAQAFSKKAQNAIIAAGGKTELINA